MRVAVVTDSTCDLPGDVAADAGVGVVPLTVSFDGDTPGGSAVTAEEFYRRLTAADRLPTTSQPSEPSFVDAWERAVEQGADAVVSLHVSAGLSGTVERARSLAASAPVPVHVVDSGQVSGGLALQVLAAARAARDGADATEVVDVARSVRGATTSLLAVDTIEFLRRGGRWAGAPSVLGTPLRVRPLLAVDEGSLALVDRVRTWRRATARLVDLVVERAGDEPQVVVVAHALDEQRADAVLGSLRERVDVARALTVVVGPVVGTHTGPGAVGLATTPAALA